MKRIMLAILVCSLMISICGSSADAQPQFNHTTIYVVDLQKSTDFYSTVMQLEKIPEPFHDNRHVWFKTGPHSQLHVVLGATSITPHNINIHLAFSVPSFDNFIAHLKANHVKFGNWAGTSETPERRPDGIYQIYFQDPEGYWIEVNNDRY